MKMCHERICEIRLIIFDNVFGSYMLEVTSFFFKGRFIFL